MHLPLQAQVNVAGDSSVGRVFVHDLRDVWHDAGEIFLAPLHFDERGWLTTVAVVGGTAILFPLDESSRRAAQRSQFSWGNNLSEIGTQYGREIYGLALSGGLYVGGLAFNDREVRQTGVMLFESIAFAGITTTVLKTIIGRSRPYVEEGAYRFRGLQFQNEHLSIPSGHATVAFSVSSVLAGRIKNTYATIGLYSLATLTAFSRVYQDEHWLSDTFLGAAIGTAVGMAVVSLHEERASRSSIHLAPMLNGVKLTYDF